MNVNININSKKEAYKKKTQEIYSTGQKITTHFLDAYIAHIDDSPMLREAYAVSAEYDGTMPFAFDDESFCGYIKSNEIAGFHYGGGVWLRYDLIDAYIAENNLGETESKKLRDDFAKIEEKRYHACRREDYTKEEFDSIEANAATSTWFGGHMVIDYETILSIGFDGYRERINKYKTQYGGDKKEFYLSLEIILGAVSRFMERFAELCTHKALLCNGENTKTCYLQKSADLMHIAKKPPETFMQALCLVWVLHMLNGSDSFGRFDFYLCPFYKNDIERGIITQQEAYNAVCDFWFLIEYVGAIQNMTIGGKGYNGENIYSELTAMCIKATYEEGFKGPNLCLRVTSDMPEYIWNEAMTSIKSGSGLPALYNDELITQNMLDFGYEQKYAYGYSFAGCSQLMVPGLCNFLNDIGIFNAAKVAEISVHDGYDPRLDRIVGLSDYNSDSFTSFDEVYNAYIKQLDYFLQLEVDIHNKEYRYRGEREGYVMRTLFMGDCIENAKNVFDKGARFNATELEVIGITNAADHLYTIKKLVFDNTTVTLKELRDALKNNWKGREDLRRSALSIEKFGNDNEEVDDMRVKITEHIYDFFNKAYSDIGGVYIPGEVIFVAHEYCGVCVGATADGRYAYSVLADSAGAMQSMDKKGPSALMNSIIKLPVRHHLLTSVVTNIKFTDHVFENERPRGKVRELFKWFFFEGGMQLQINVCSGETLRKAQANPDEYRSLVVRVGGYSDYFVNLSKALQDEIILRSSHQV